MDEVLLAIALLMCVGLAVYARHLRDKLDDAEEFIAVVSRIRTRCREMNNTPASREWAYDELLWLLDNSKAATTRSGQCATD